MTRRDFITLIGGAVAVPLAARAQHAPMPVIGYLGPNFEQIDRPRVTAFAQRLSELGWVEGRNVTIERRAADGLAERNEQIASDFVRNKVDVILTSGDAAGLAAKRATAVIPIVIAIIGEPVGSGLVDSLSRPGGNVTGLSIVQSETAGKRLELLREVVPGLRRPAIFVNLSNRGAALESNAAQAAARALSLDPVAVGVRSGEEIPTVIESLKGRADALYVCVDPLVSSNSVRINTLALQARLPVMHSFRDYAAEAGGLISYGPDIVGMYRHSADLVDKILRGAKPADIPIEQPTKFTLVVNLKTAAMLGLKIPESFLARVDEVIE